MFIIPNIPIPLSREIFANLCSYLPDPAPSTPEARAARDQRAMTAVAHLLPENAAEAELAVQIVANDFHAKDALRWAALPGLDPGEMRRHRAQAASLSRTVQSGIRTLMRMQAERQKAEDARRPAAMERAGYWFRDVGDAATTTPEPATTPFEQMSEEEQYAVMYPQRAALIRARGGVPPDVTFGPPDPDLALRIVHSASPILRELDQAKHDPGMMSQLTKRRDDGETVMATAPYFPSSSATPAPHAPPPHP